MRVEPYVFFEGCCEEAVNFYRDVLGAEVLSMQRFKDMPEGDGPNMTQPGMAEKIMHATIKIGETTIMASDGQCSGSPHFAGVSLSLSVADAVQAQRIFATLSDQGQIRMPLTKTFFSSSFGMLADRFGVSWLIVAAP